MWCERKADRSDPVELMPHGRSELVDGLEEVEEDLPGVCDWSCGFDIPDAVGVERTIVRDCQAVDYGRRSGTVPADLYLSGF